MSDRLGLKIKKAVLSRLAFGLFRFLGGSQRLELIGWEPYAKDDSKLIFCGWHGKSLIFANYFRKRGYWVIISNSNDGDIQNRVFQLLGFQSIRGSTGRGGVKAALQGVKALKAGGTMAITPDGPRGPSGVVQGGVMMMAQRSGARLVPVGISAKRAWYAKSWDRYMIPQLFSRARLVFGDPMSVPADATDDEVESIRLKFEQHIQAAQETADRW